MKLKDRIFKAGVIVASIAEILFLWGIIYVSVSEYDPIHTETIGITIASITAVCGSLVFLALIYYVLRWKGDVHVSHRDTIAE
jgi:uncharacterized membrane-anchored protein